LSRCISSPPVHNRFSSPPTCLQTLIHFPISDHVTCTRRSLIYANQALQVEPKSTVHGC
jgi:hypothetical protein